MGFWFVREPPLCSKFIVFLCVIYITKLLLNLTFLLLLKYCFLVEKCMHFLENLILSDKKNNLSVNGSPFILMTKYYFSKHICLIISWKVDTFSTLGIGKNVMSSGDKRKWDCWEEYKPRISNRKFLSSNGRTSQNEKEISLFRM